MLKIAAIHIAFTALSIFSHLTHGNSAWAQVHDDYDFQWTQSLYPPYVDGHGDNQHWMIEGFTSSADSYIRLTSDEPNQRGHVSCNKVLFLFVMYHLTIYNIRIHLATVNAF